MPRLATAEDFNGVLYNPPYYEFPFFAERAAWIAARYPGVGKVAVIGAALGYLVKHLRLLGIDAWGADQSAWALTQVPPELSAYMFYADLSRNKDRNDFKAFCGLSGNQKFSLAVTEDVLPCLTDNETVALCNVINGSAVNALHIVTPLGSGSNQHPGLNWKTFWHFSQGK
jgi:hypothetical protein